MNIVSILYTKNYKNKEKECREGHQNLKKFKEHLIILYTNSIIFPIILSMTLAMSMASISTEF
jgi:hypothetical protein